jgi:outer membrane receptor protein involved in Fe transport
LNASGGPLTGESFFYREQRNALFGKVGLAWKSTAFLDITGRNDWSSTLDAAERSYFYPSVAGSLVLTEILPTIDWLSFWKVRGSWTQTKLPAGIYSVIQAYDTYAAWGTQKGATYPTTIRAGGLKPQTTEGWEIGTAANFFGNRLKFDLTYYQKLYYNNQSTAPVSDATGFANALVNNDEQYMRKGWEITLSGDVVRTKDFTWTPAFNWSTYKYTYHQLDETYSSKDYWVAVGERADAFSVTDWERVPETGEYIFQNGMAINAVNPALRNRLPDWTWGFSNDLRYKNFNLLISLDGRVGGYGYDIISEQMWVNGSHPDSDNEWRYAEVVDLKTNYIAPGVKIVSGEVTYNADRTIESDTRVYAPNDVEVSYQTFTRDFHRNNRAMSYSSMTFFKLREVALGYTLPKSISQKIRTENIQVSLVGQNLFLWAKEFRFSDPETFNGDIWDSSHYLCFIPSPSERYIGFNIKSDF